MAAKKAVKKAVAKAPAKKASAPAKKASAKKSSSGSDSPGTGFKDIDAQIEAVWAKRGNKPLFDPRTSLTQSDRSRDSRDFREINKLYDRAAQLRASQRAAQQSAGASAPAQRGGNLGSFLRGGGLRRGGR